MFYFIAFDLKYVYSILEDVLQYTVCHTLHGISNSLKVEQVPGLVRMIDIYSVHSCCLSYKGCCENCFCAQWHSSIK